MYLYFYIYISIQGVKVNRDFGAVSVLNILINFLFEWREFVLFSVINKVYERKIMSIKVTFEIGHEAKLKTKTTPDGFTHDWELYVKGCDGNDISQFVEKVVFNLHESFPKPKRGIYYLDNFTSTFYI